MLRLLVCCFAVVQFVSHGRAQSDTTDTGFLGGAAVPGKMIAAKHEFNENNMRGALILYREVLAIEPDNAKALYWTARCHYALKRYDLAEEYLGKAIIVNPGVRDDVDFRYGEINHRLARVDEAIEYYERFRAVASKKSYEYELAGKYIEQCRFAKEQMELPVDVTITNMGKSINSRFDDYTPSINQDGTLMMFTSRRSGKDGGVIDEGGDYKFFEDIYYSEYKPSRSKDDPPGTLKWSTARAAEGGVNTPAYDAVLSISPDGKTMFIYKNNRESAGDIFKAGYDKHDEEWRIPERMPRPVNTTYYEGSCSITSDGNFLYFISERPGGQGRGDIYVSERDGEDWGSPKNLGPVINTKDDEKFVFIHPNGKTLYFASNGHPGMGGYDIYKSEFVDGQWGIPVNLGYPINTVNEESTFSLTKDNQTMLIAAEYDDSFGERDIYLVDVSRYDLVSSGYDSNGFGTIVVQVKDAAGQRIGRANIQIKNNYSDRVLAEAKTDKSGEARVSLPGNTTYQIFVETKKAQATSTVKLELKPQGTTVETVEVQLN